MNFSTTLADSVLTCKVRVGNPSFLFHQHEDRFPGHLPQTPNTSSATTSLHSPSRLRILAFKAYIARTTSLSFGPSRKAGRRGRFETSAPQVQRSGGSGEDQYQHQHQFLKTWKLKRYLPNRSKGLKTVHYACFKCLLKDEILLYTKQTTVSDLHISDSMFV
jgi:hypothetical protein